jgi:putative acetyltransferase
MPANVLALICVNPCSSVAHFVPFSRPSRSSRFAFLWLALVPAAAVAQQTAPADFVLQNGKTNTLDANSARPSHCLDVFSADYCFSCTEKQIKARGSIPVAAMQITLDNLTRPDVHDLLREHVRDMHLYSPPESVHALDLNALRRPEISFWTVWNGDELLGCGALKELDSQHGEIKSMRTAAAHLRKGVARALLAHIVAEARRRGYRRLSLETGSSAAFTPAQKLYESIGFTYCGPFDGYVDDPYSVFMTLPLGTATH